MGGGLTNPDEQISSDGLVMAFARVLNHEAKALAEAGAAVLQIDEPFLAGYPDEVGLAVKAINTVFDGITGPARALHVCYGNRYARPVWEGHYEFLFPTILDAQVDRQTQLVALLGLYHGELTLQPPHRVQSPTMVGRGRPQESRAHGRRHVHRRHYARDAQQDPGDDARGP